MGVIGGKREAMKYNVWCMQHPNATKEEHHAFLQSLLDDPENSIKAKEAKDAGEKPKPAA